MFCKDSYFAIGIAPRLVWFILLIAYSHSTNGTPVIYRCCHSIGKSSQTNNTELNSSEPVTITDKDLILVNNTTIHGINNSSNITSLQVDQCHPNPKSLTSTISIRPNQVNAGFYHSTGYLRNDNELFSPIQYCISSSAKNEFLVNVLQHSGFCSENHCLRKCCGPLEVYDLSTYGKSKLQCVSSANNPWSPQLYPLKNVSNTADIHFYSEHPLHWCTSGDIVVWTLRPIGPDRKSLFRTMKNGSVVKKSRAEWKVMNTSRICIDGAINIPGYFDNNVKQSTFSGDELDTIMLECGPELEETSTHPIILYGIALAVSAVFQFATLVVYGLLWDKQNVHGWTILGFITTMFLFYVSMLATFIYLYHYPDQDFVTQKEIFMSFCGVIAVLTHFLYLCTICWLTVISTDIFLTFRILKLTRTRSKNKVKFLIYLLFTLFVPSLIVSVGLFLDINYGDDVEINVILPRYGWDMCFLDLKKAALPYLFGPIGILLLYNCVMYFATIFHLYRLQEATKFANTNNSKVRKDRAKIRLFSKLFLLMGVSWVLEVISFLALGGEANIPVIICDVLNILQPIAIFIVFVCKKDIVKSLSEKYSIVTKIFPSFEPEECVTSSSSERVPRLTKLWNPVTRTNQWFRSRINSTQTDTSNLSNLSIKSISANVIDEIPTPIINSSSPLNMETEDSSTI